MADILELAKRIGRADAIAAGMDFVRPLAEYVIQREEGVPINSADSTGEVKTVGHWYACPSCKRDLCLVRTCAYCPNCGVRLIWKAQ